MRIVFVDVSQDQFPDVKAPKALLLFIIRVDLFYLFLAIA